MVRPCYRLGIQEMGEGLALSEANRFPGPVHTLLAQRSPRLPPAADIIDQWSASQHVGEKAALLRLLVVGRAGLWAAR